MDRGGGCICGQAVEEVAGHPDSMQRSGPLTHGLSGHRAPRQVLPWQVCALSGGSLGRPHSGMEEIDVL
jgi:hypothetical protein